MSDDSNTPDADAPRPASSSQRLRLSWGGATHQGQVRPVNEDALFADRGLFVVADGMGGHQAGEVASRITVKTLAGREHHSMGDLVTSVGAANTAVFEHASSSDQYKGMGTTLTALSVIGDGKPPMLGLVNVGDSRVYRMRDGALAQLTEDHSYVAELVRRGQISEAEAETHPYRNMLTRAIGVGDSVDVDQWELEPYGGDIYLLCSDGLTNEIEEDEILAVLSTSEDPTEAARELITRANRAGGRDNVTVVIVMVDVEDVEPEPAAPPVADLSPMDTGVISAVASTAPETAEMVGLAEELDALGTHETEPIDEISAVLDELEELEADLASTTAVVDPEILAAATAAAAAPDTDPTPVVDPEQSAPPESEDPPAPTPPVPHRPGDALAAYDLPPLDGDDATLPWLTDPDEAAPDDEPANEPVEAEVEEPAEPEHGDDDDDAVPVVAAVPTTGEDSPVDQAETTVIETTEPVEMPEAASVAEPEDLPEPEPAPEPVVEPDPIDPAMQQTTVIDSRAESPSTTQPVTPFTDPVTASGPVDHFAPAVRGWKAPVAITWRSLVFVTVVIAVVVAAGALVAWYARSAYYVGYSGDEVVIYQGRPDGVLWFDPTLEESTGIFRQDLPPAVQAEVEALFETGTLEGARAFVEEIRPPSSGADPPEADEQASANSPTP